MEITIFQKTKKKTNGRYDIYIALWRVGKRTLLSSGMESVHPLIKIKGIGIGVAFDKKEPNGRIKQKRLEDIYWKVDEIVNKHPGISVIDIKNLVQRSLGTSSGPSIISLLQEHKGRESTNRIYEHTAKLVSEFDKDAELSITPEWLARFEQFLIEKGTTTNGISIHMRNIRTIFNQARRDELTSNYPFLKFKIKTQRKPIKAMSLEQLKELERIGTIYTDIFMLMFYLAGINIGDLLRCEKLTNGRMIYTRQKTSKPINIPVFPPAMEIIEKYKGKNHLLSIIETNKSVLHFTQRMNKRLKETGVFEGLSTYVARYTFASIAAECGVSRDVIAACLGHSWADVTSHYVAYSQKQIDDAVKKVVDYVAKPG